MALLGSKNPKLTAMMHGEIPSLVKQAKDIIINAFKQTGGDVQAAAKKLPIGRATLNRWIKDNPDLREALDKIRLKNR